MTARPRVALAPAAQWPDLDEDGREVLAAVHRVGVDAVPAVWDDPAVDWAAYERYRRELAVAGVPVVPTAFVTPGEAPPTASAPRCGRTSGYGISSVAAIRSSTRTAVS